MSIWYRLLVWVRLLCYVDWVVRVGDMGKIHIMLSVAILSTEHFCYVHFCYNAFQNMKY